MPEPLSSEDLEAIWRSAAKVVETFGDDWPLHYDFDEVSCRTANDNTCEDAYVEIFNTSQWQEGEDRSPLAEFLASSIVVIPRLLAEVERLKAQVSLLGSHLQRDALDVTNRLRAQAAEQEGR